MSKALENENIRRTDFIHALSDGKTQANVTHQDGPNLQDILSSSILEEEEEETDDKDSDSMARAVPVNIHTLRKLVEKKFSKD